MTNKGLVKSTKRRNSRGIKLYDLKDRGPVVSTSHIPWITWPKLAPGYSEESPAHDERDKLRIPV